MIVTNKKPNIIHVNGIRLKPGVNTVDGDWWAKTRKHPTIQKKLELGLLVEEYDAELSEIRTELDGKDADREADFEHIKTLSVSNASRLVQETVDLELLKA